MDAGGDGELFAGAAGLDELVELPIGLAVQNLLAHVGRLEAVDVGLETVEDGG